VAKADGRERDQAARRARRAESQEAFDRLAVAYLDQQGVSQGPMFGSQGLLRNGKFLAFVGRAGDLVLKLPEHEATDLVTSGQATAVRAGRNATREWVSVPMPAGGKLDRWRELLADAYAYAGQQASSPER
jgi:TfoX/Sxy family transcriptional regulator of competence genes